MKLYVEAALGFGESRRRWMGCGQRVSVGSSEWADLTISEDSMMDDVHFEIIGSDDDFVVRDLSGTSGLYVNGEPVGVCRVQNEDLLHAGATQFRVNVDMPDSGTAVIRIVHEELCPSGVIKTHGPGMTPSETVVRMLHDGFHFIVDASLAPATIGYGQQQQILNTAAAVGPVLVSPPDGRMAQKLCSVLDGQEFTVVISSKSPVATLTEVRQKVGSFIEASTLREQLESSPVEFAQLLTKGFDAILITERSNDCQIFANEGYKCRLEDRTSGLN